jgi:signal transduction histidine kinase
MANRAKSELLAKVSHETRQPVHATVGWVDTLALEIHGAVSDAQREALRRIKQNQSRLLSVLNDLLDMSRIEAGKLELRAGPVVVAEVIDAVESAVAPQIADRGIAYDFRRPPATLVAHADRDQLIGILTNLLSNAAKFTSRGGQVSVECRAEEGRVALAVRDTGIGIVPELQERVFEPFFQIESGFTRTTVGTGLGLAISREAARAMGGEITLSSEPGRGSVFTVWLPGA